MIYRFGHFTLDTERETLTSRTGQIALRGQALLVLKLLIERAPNVVSRDEILEQVWGHHATSESTIAQVMRDIRVALDDSTHSPRLVATRYGRGYQFIGDVKSLDNHDDRLDAEHQPDTAKTHLPASRQTSKHPIRMLLLFTMLATGFAGWQWFRGESTMPAADASELITLRAITADNGESLSAAFVDYLAFVLGNALDGTRITVARDESDIDPSSRVIEVSLASLQSGDKRPLELALGEAAFDDPELRLRIDQASELLHRGLAELVKMLELEVDTQLRLEAGLVSQSSFAVETLLRGMAAQFAGDVKRAAKLFEAALAEDPDFEFARYELAIAIRRDGDNERALTILKPMSERLVSDFWVQRINNALGITLWQMKRYDEALVALRRAESTAKSPLTRAIVLSNIGLLERNLERFEQAEATLRAAVQLAENADNKNLSARSRNSLASVLMKQGRNDEALAQLAQASELFYESGDLRGYGAVLSRSARIHAARGERAETESLLRLALGIREQIGDQIGIADIQIRLARIHRVRGEFDQARELGRSALELARALDDNSLLTDCYQELAAQALADQNYDQARAYASEGLRLAELAGREGDQLAIRHGLLEIDFATLSQAAAHELEAQLEALMRAADAAEDRSIGVRTRILAARFFAQLKRPDDAYRVLDRANELPASDDVRLWHEVAAAQAEIYLDRADLDRAERAINRLEQTNAPPHPMLMLKARLQADQGMLKSAVETAALARSSSGDWWQPEHQDLLDTWSAALLD